MWAAAISSLVLCSGYTMGPGKICLPIVPLEHKDVARSNTHFNHIDISFVTLRDAPMRLVVAVGLYIRRMLILSPIQLKPLSYFSAD